MNLRQPALGVVSTIICIIFAFIISAQFSVITFNSWVGFVATAMIPSQIIIALVWSSNYPKWLNQLHQPLKGFCLLMLMLIMGLIISFISLLFIGGIEAPPTPMVIMFTIFSVITTMWLVVVWDCWPMRSISKHTGIIALGTLALAYLISGVLFYILFDFSFLSGAPFYSSQADPSGLFNAWAVLSFSITTLAIIDGLILFDFWPMTKLQRKIRLFENKLIFSTINSISILICAYCLWHLFVTYLHLDMVVYTVTIAVPLIFGEIIILAMMQTAPFTQLKQPLKGGYSLVLSILLAICAYWLYKFMSVQIVGNIESGIPSYNLESWIATAMLSITFPLFIIFSDFLEFNPLISRSNDK